MYLTNLKSFGDVRYSRDGPFFAVLYPDSQIRRLLQSNCVKVFAYKLKEKTLFWVYYYHYCYYF